MEKSKTIAVIAPNGVSPDYRIIKSANMLSNFGDVTLVAYCMPPDDEDETVERPLHVRFVNLLKYDRIIDFVKIKQLSKRRRKHKKLMAGLGRSSTED